MTDVKEIVKRLRAATMRFDWSDIPDDEPVPAIPLLREAANALSALSPAPEAGSDEVERLRAELSEAIRRGEDQWAGWVKETAALRAAEARETALREKLGRMREELACTYEELIEHTGDDMDDSRQKRVNELLAAETQEAGR